MTRGGPSLQDLTQELSRKISNEFCIGNDQDKENILFPLGDDHSRAPYGVGGNVRVKDSSTQQIYSNELQ